MIRRETNGRFRRRRLRRRRKLRNAAYLEEITASVDSGSKGKASAVVAIIPPPAPAAKVDWKAEIAALRARLAKLDRDEIKNELDRLEVEYDGRLGSERLRATLLQASMAEFHGNGG